jgi:sugar porter (SP) family MFS transporter
MGSVLSLKSFKEDFGLPTDSGGFASARNAQISSNVVSLLTAGCFFGSIFAAFLNERIGRRYSLMIFALVFLLGAAIQVGSHHEIGMIYGGRVVAGLGIGGMSSITPVFVSENCPPATRGRIAGLFQEFLVIGSTFAYWLDYGVSLHVSPGTTQWRIPVAIQLIPGGLMFIGLFFLKESPRWLMKQGRGEEALVSLAYIRNEPTDSEQVEKEIAEIRASLEEELSATEGVTWKEVLQKGNRYRFFLAFTLMFWQQFSGTNSIGYYAPQIFQTVGVSATNSALFATGVYGTVKIVATLIFLLVGIDFIGRKKALVGGAFWMSSMMFIIGAVLATHAPNVKSDTVSQASIAMVAMIYLYVIGYSASWGPTPWVYVSEVSHFSYYIFSLSGTPLSICAKWKQSSRSFLPASERTVSAPLRLRSGSSTSSSRKSPPARSTTSDGEPFSCLASSAWPWECSCCSSSRKRRAAVWRTWTSCSGPSTRLNVVPMSSRSWRRLE